MVAGIATNEITAIGNGIKETTASITPLFMIITARYAMTKNR